MSQNADRRSFKKSVADTVKAEGKREKHLSQNASASVLYEVKGVLGNVTIDLTPNKNIALQALNETEVDAVVYEQNAFTGIKTEISNNYVQRMRRAGPGFSLQQTARLT